MTPGKVDAELDSILAEMANACISGDLQATITAVENAHARFFAAVLAEREACAQMADKRERQFPIALSLNPTNEQLFNSGFGAAAFMIAEDIRDRSKAAGL